MNISRLKFMFKSVSLEKILLYNGKKYVSVIFELVQDGKCQEQRLDFLIQIV